jgi:hypothetical protein
LEGFLLSKKEEIPQFLIELFVEFKQENVPNNQLLILRIISAHQFLAKND